VDAEVGIFDSAPVVNTGESLMYFFVAWRN